MLWTIIYKAIYCELAISGHSMPEATPTPMLPERHRGHLVLVCLTAVGLILFYVVLFPIKGIRVPAWSDAQAYIWWTRRAGALGLRAFGTGSRPATVASLATLS